MFTYETTTAPGFSAFHDAQLVGRDRRGERAAGVEVGDEDGLLRAEDRRRLGHEVDAAEDDRVSASVAAASRESPSESPTKSRDVLHLGHLVVVGEDHRVPLGGERADLLLHRRDLRSVVM